MGRYLKAKTDPRSRIEPLLVEEERSLLETARNDFPRAYPLFLCALRTGMRLGELFGLQWGDIDFEGHFIEVRRTVKDGGKVFPPKNGKIRRLDLSDQLDATLRALLVERKAETLRKGWPEVPDWVFCSDQPSQVRLRAPGVPQTPGKGWPTSGSFSRSPPYVRVTPATEH
jgi:integrase